MLLKGYGKYIQQNLVSIDELARGNLVGIGELASGNLVYLERVIFLGGFVLFCVFIE